jgi:hypothetical protein
MNMIALTNAITQWSLVNQSNVTLPNLIWTCESIIRNQLSHIPNAQAKVIDRINMGDHPLREAIWNVEKGTP